MKPSRPRRSGVLSLRTLGRGFWLGILVSVLLHAWLLGSADFQMPKWADPPEPETTIEARLEPLEPLSPVAAAAPAPRANTPTSAPDAPPPSPSPAQPEPSLAPQPVASDASPAAPTLPATPSESPPAAPPPPAKPMQSPVSALVSGNLKELPRKLEIVFELKGMLSGRQIHRWQRSGERYSLETEAEVTGLASLFVRGKLTQKSQGRIGAPGLIPEHYEMQRLSGSREILDFDYAESSIAASRFDAKRGKRSLELPLLPGTQDPLSSIYQLAMAAREDGEGILVAAGAKHVKGYPYRVLGMETLNTAFASLKALHVTRSGDSGNSAVHLWLSPQHYYLPVRVTFVDDEGAEWVLEATRIDAE